MKYYSEVTKKLYETAKELEAAEQNVKNLQAAKIKAEELKKEQRATRAKEVEEALKAATEANKKATKLLKEFTKDYGYYHTSFTTKEDESFDDFWDVLHSFLL